MRDKQPERIARDLRMPKTLYAKMLAVVRDYARTKAEYNDMIFRSPSFMGACGAKNTSSPTENAVIKMIDHYGRTIDAVENALSIIPKEYRAGVIQKCLNDRYGQATFYVSERTLARWKQIFLYRLAQNMGEI